MKSAFYSICLLLAVLFSTTVNAQDKKEHISKLLSDYFFLERENIHVQLDKDVFMTNEAVWFKGYVYHRKTGKPFYSCVNIFVSLIDEEGKILQNDLLYGDIGSFSGKLDLGDELKSGKYYLQFYTNWMNNFKEDESFIREITVINPTISPSFSRGINYSDININLFPEGGTLVAGVNNVVGVTIADCNNTPVSATEVYLTNSSGEKIKSVSVNESGYGRFTIIPEATETYKVVANIKNTPHEQQLERAQLKGASLEVNSYVLAEKVIVKVRASDVLKKEIGTDAVYLVAHKDEKSSVFKFNLSEETEVNMILNISDFSTGLNTFRLLDSNLDELAYRLAYIQPDKTLPLDIQKKKFDKEIAELTGKSPLKNAKLSVTILPDNTMALKEHNDMYGSLLLAPYIENNRRIDAKKYFKEVNRKTLYELDLFLLTNKSKYAWRNIKSSPPESNYTFDMGITIKGTLNQKIRNTDKYRINATSIGGILDETVGINDKNEFILDHMVLADSTKIDFSLINGDKREAIKLYPQVFNNIRRYNKPYIPETVSCKPSETDSTLPEVVFPGIVDMDAIILDEVELTGQTRGELKYETSFGNAQLRGYKISEDETVNFFYILDLIRYHGFDVEDDGMNINVYGRTVNTINGQRSSPMLYVNNVRQLTFDFLRGMQTADVDEFYVNQHAIVPSVDNKMGIIKIYMRTDFTGKKNKKTSTDFIITDGFQQVEPFKNTEYFTTYSKGFENFGVIDWEPLITSDEKGEFSFEIPYTGQDAVRILIEGMSPEGNIISETKTIYLN
ncbi:hypothetical protein [Flavobacterium suaedae]|uniref:hypothetical protein n=1 Tax=Flavobacterium suaedae TaxID=1767027 RepID=UPI0016653E8F|nr:hypothetical protein [Flavobacterium suaedae]